MSSPSRLRYSTAERFARLTVNEALMETASGQDGITHAEAKRRLRTYGPNTLVIRKRQTAVQEYLSKYKNPLTLTLLVVAIISWLLGERVDAGIVFCMVLLSTTLDFIQEHKATREAEKLMERVATTAVVVRGGEEVKVQAAHLVPGDIILLNAGDLVPADARILEVKDCFVNQSTLTGESFPVRKSHRPVHEEHPDLTDMNNLVFMGTGINTGTCRAVVFQTGIQTMFGTISASLAVASEENDFTRGMHSFGRLILRVIMLFVLIIFTANSLLSQDILQALLFAIAVAVGMTPEFLPMIMSITMGQGAASMERHGVIVKKLTAIPAFGSMDVLCTDKTGTLTRDKIELVRYLDGNGVESDEVFTFTYLNSHFQTGISSPMDQAVLDFKKISLTGYEKVDEIPFDFERRRMSVIVRHTERNILITKGAPETVLAICSEYVLNGKVHGLTSCEREKFAALAQQLSAEGFRVLALARKYEDNHLGHYSRHDETEMCFMGFTAFLDPVKPGVRQSIKALEELGIEVKVITGDNELVAQKICSQAGIPVKRYLLGHQIDHLTAEKLRQVVEETTIFARFSPVQKNRVIAALRDNGHVVGYMGDGINDAPSLKTADVGISVTNAVPVAKESADLILTGKSFEVLGQGVTQGRKTFGNTMKYIHMGLSSNFGNMLSLAGAILFLPYLPMLPKQILLNNFLYDFAQMVLPADRVDTDYLKNPKRWNIREIRTMMLIFGPVSSIFDFLTFFLLYRLFPANPAAFQTGWFIESLATQVFVIYVIRTRKLPFIQSMPSPALLISTIAVVATGWVLPFTALGAMFGFVPLPVPVLILLAGITVAYLLIAEIAKRFYYRIVK
ncbi:MAG: magnesium-translocating P-type ATPase [Patescibacteria group bacterium]|nr:magnesium-translocating P-type ATPase [Patescibacteria group bacterium]